MKRYFVYAMFYLLFHHSTHSMQNVNLRIRNSTEEAIILALRFLNQQENKPSSPKEVLIIPPREMTSIAASPGIYELEAQLVGHRTNSWSLGIKEETIIDMTHRNLSNGKRNLALFLTDRHVNYKFFPSDILKQQTPAVITHSLLKRSRLLSNLYLAGLSDSQ